MGKKLRVPGIKTLKSDSQNESTLLNLRLEKRLLLAFKRLCDEELDESVSEVLRKCMTELCVKAGYLKK